MERLAIWHQTTWGFLTFGAVELAAVYVVASMAINSGALWQYVLGILLLIGGIRNVVKFIRNLFHYDHKTARA
ncbi:MAG: hypothetical protein ACREBW_02235 [Candidatus Micrarchaeaceae archaeon]